MRNHLLGYAREDAIFHNDTFAKQPGKKGFHDALFYNKFCKTVVRVKNEFLQIEMSNALKR